MGTANIPVDLTSLVWTRNPGCRSPRFSAAFHCLLAALACLERLTFICVLLRRRVPGLSPGEDRRGQIVALGAFFVDPLRRGARLAWLGEGECDLVSRKLTSNQDARFHEN